MPSRKLALHHLPCNEIQFLKAPFGNSLLELVSDKHFFPKRELSTEDDGEPNIEMASKNLLIEEAGESECEERY